MIQAVPEMFKPKIRVEYPPDNKQIFEEWFYDNAYNDVQEPWITRHYLPIFWTSFQVNNDYGKGRKMHDLQAYIDGLDRSKKYFTITQYDDGPLVDFKDLDIKVFGSGGGRIDCPIPLVCMPHPYPFKKINHLERKYLACFIGSITHPIRQHMIDSIPLGQRHRYYISTKPHTIEQFCEVMNDSVFALCPRGYGKTSFRICEALQYLTIPLYISDEYIIPGGWTIEGKATDIPLFSSDQDWMNMFLHETFENIMSNNSKPHDSLVNLIDRSSEIYFDWYTYEGLKNKILEWLKRL
jgi:hypothetical protein